MSITSSESDGVREKNGHWKPSYPAGFAPMYERPFRCKKFLKWLFGWGGYLWPSNALYAVLAWVAFTYLQPGIEAYAQPGVGDMLILLARNVALIIIVYGFQHIVLYGLKLHGRNRKYNPQWPAKDAKRFLFRNQNLDNMFWTIVSGGIVWTAYEVLYFWMVANGWVATLSWSTSPVLIVAIFLLIPFYRESHFSFVHRLIHWKPLFRVVHKIHHKNYNPAPFSGMAMSPLEHILYFSHFLIFFIVPVHPIHYVFSGQLAGLTPAKGHTGFEPPLFKGLMPTGDYFHYLHHKYVSVNFGTPTVPWDRWLGKYYDGTTPYKSAKSKT